MHDETVKFNSSVQFCSFKGHCTWSNNGNLNLIHTPRL